MQSAIKQRIEQAITQALANARLEGVEVSEEVIKRVRRDMYVEYGVKEET